MRRFLLIIALIISGLGLNAHCSTVEYDGFSLDFVVTDVTDKKCEVVCNSAPETEMTIVIPSSVMIEGVEYSVTSLGYEAFYDCDKLTGIEIPNHAETVPYAENMFHETSSDLIVYVPAVSIDLYKADEYWNIRTIKEISDGTTVTVVATPNEGYKFISWTEDDVIVSEDAEYTFVISHDSDLVANFAEDVNYWDPDETMYPNNMSITAVVEIDGEEQRTTDIEIGAFCGDEVRGSNRLKYEDGVLDRYFLYITIYGESQDEIMFRYYDVENSEEYAFPSEEIVVFGVNSTVGSIKEPYELQFGMLGVEEMNTQEFTVYPNPATVSEEIYLGGNFEMVEVYNALGVKVAIYENVDKIESLETTGIYVIKVVNGSESRYCRVIVR